MRSENVSVLVSVVIPVHNGEKYIKNLLLPSQTICLLIGTLFQVSLSQKTDINTAFLNNMQNRYIKA